MATMSHHVALPHTPPPPSKSRRVADEGRNEEANIGVMVMHGQPRTSTSRVFKCPPTIGEINVTVVNLSGPCFRSRPTSEGPTESIFLMNIDIRRHNGRVTLLNRRNSVQNLQLKIFDASNSACNGAKGWSSDSAELLMHCKQPPQPLFNF
jgi:hypothetical protein